MQSSDGKKLRNPGLVWCVRQPGQ